MNKQSVESVRERRNRILRDYDDSVFKLKAGPSFVCRLVDLIRLESDNNGTSTKRTEFQFRFDGKTTEAHYEITMSFREHLLS